jgi:hypothetical protein
MPSASTTATFSPLVRGGEALRDRGGEAGPPFLEPRVARPPPSEALEFPVAGDLADLLLDRGLRALVIVVRPHGPAVARQLTGEDRRAGEQAGVSDDLPARRAGCAEPDLVALVAAHDLPELEEVELIRRPGPRPRDAQALVDRCTTILRDDHVGLADRVHPRRPGPRLRAHLFEVGETLLALVAQPGGPLGVGGLAGVAEAARGLSIHARGLLGDPGARLRGLAPLLVLQQRPRLLLVAGDHQQDVLGRELLLRGGVVRVAHLRLDQLAEPARFAVDQAEAVAVGRAVSEVVVDADRAERVALAHGPAVALLEVGRCPRQIEVVDRAGADLEIDALVGDRVRNHHVELRRDRAVRWTCARAWRRRLG